MRSAILAVALGSLLVISAVAQDTKETDQKSRIPQQGDIITVTGCIAGSTIRDLDTGYTFRLKGEKGLLKEIEKAHKGHNDELKGELKSSLQMGDMKGKRVGRTTISIGIADSRNPGAPRELNPVLEVKSIRHRPGVCRD